MAYIFMDESWDLWFTKNKKSSKYFIVTFLFSVDKKPLDKIVKKIFSWLKKTNVKVSGGMLHATKEKPTTRTRLLRFVAWLSNVYVMTIYLDKSKVYTRLHDEKHVLYNYIVNILIRNVITKKLLPINQPIEFIASRRETSKVLNNNFIEYLKSQNVTNQLDIDFIIKTPHQEKWLQIVDFICWAVYQKYERNDSSYYNNISSLIIEEKWLFE